MTAEPEKQEFEVVIDVPEGYREDARLDVFLTRELLNATRSKVQRGIKQGRVSINGHPAVKSSQTVQAGDRIRCRILRPPSIQAAPEAIPLDVVYEDDWLMIVNKPPGMVVHPAYGSRSGTLVNALLYHVGGSTVTLESLADDDADAGLSTSFARPSVAQDPSIRPGIVHRLDKDTSGLIVVAKDDATHANLAHQFAERTTKRDYLGIVFRVPPADGMIEGAIGRDRRDRKKMAVVDPGRGKAAVTHFEKVEAFSDSALVRFRLETGRTHQIRVHAASRGHPLLGDELYGGRDLKRLIPSRTRRAFYRNLIARLDRQALHARSLGFVHPATGEQVRFEADLPDDMRLALEHLRANP